MSKENKTAELNDDELSKVSGGGNRPFLSVTVEAGYYLIANNKYLYLESNITGAAGSTVNLPKYELHPNGSFVPCGANVVTLEELSQMEKYNS